MFTRRPHVYNVQFHLLSDPALSPPVCRSFPSRSKGGDLLSFLCSHLKIFENDYFGLLVKRQSGEIRWLNEEKSIKRQFKGDSRSSSHVDLFFRVKFFVPHPDSLQHEVTRYQYFLQVRRDIVTGSLLLTDFTLAANLFALILQSQLGNFDPERDTENYSSQFYFVPMQTHVLEAKAQEIHKTLTNVCPGEAEWSFLRQVKSLTYYGVDLHSVTGESNVLFILGICASGLLVFRGQSRLASYAWNRMVKIERHGNRVCFTVRGRSSKADVHVFQCPSKDSAKHLCDCANQHRVFFLSHGSEGMTDMFASTKSFCPSFASSLQFERVPMKLNPKRELPPPRALFPADSTLNWANEMAGIRGGGSNRRSVMSVGGSGLTLPKCRSRIQKVYVARQSAGSDTEAYNVRRDVDNAVSMNAHVGTYVRKTEGTSVPIPRKMYRLSAVEIDDHSDVESIVSSKRLQNNREVSLGNEEMKLARFEKRQISQSSRLSLKSERLNLSRKEFSQCDISNSTKVPTYEQHISRSYGAIPRFAGALAERSLSPIAASCGSIGSQMSEDMNKRTGKLAEDKVLSKDSGVGVSSGAIESANQEEDQDVIRCLTPVQVCSTPCSLKSTVGKFRFESNSSSDDSERVKSNHNFVGSADTSGFERSTFTVYL